MKEHYYVNDIAQTTGEHEIHKKDCTFFPKNNTYLGYFDTCQEAIEKAKTIYSNVDGCHYCCSECDTK